MSRSDLYLKLAEDLRENEGQWAAYESKGHCVVLAGPGSGKTKTLTLKLARFLAEDVEEPRGVACITYNNECARELETRLDALGVQAGGRVFIGTIHSFSLTQIILPYASVANMGLPDQFVVATKVEAATALQQAYDRVVGGPANMRDVDSAMGKYRRSILNRDSEEWHSRNPDMAALVVAYEEELRGMGRIDYDDMPLVAVRALRDNPWLQQALLAKYPILAVDEYQDLGSALHRMVLGLCFSAGMRLFAVGDVDQSIYGFTGADPALLQALSKREDVEPVHLKLNYRCGSKIVRAAGYALGEQRGYEAPKGAHEGTIFFHPRSGGYPAQADYIFTTILPDVFDRNPGMSIADVAVLYPAAWIGDYVADAAAARGQSFVRTDTNALYPRSSRVLRWLEQCAEWCCGGWQTGKPRFRRLVLDGSRIFDEALASPDARQDFQRKLVEGLWSRRNSTASLYTWFRGLDAAIIQPLAAKCRGISDDVDVFQQFVARTSPGQDCADMTLAQFAGQSVGANCLNLTSLHSSKGREFPIVIMFGMDNGRIPRNGATQNEAREARRLFYVGFTRAKTELHIAYTHGRPSPFVIEVARRIDEEH